MKKFTLILLMLVGITSFAQNNQVEDHKDQSMRTERQNKMTAEQRADQMTKKLTEKLDLNVSQQAKVRALYLKDINERKDNMAEHRDEMSKEKMKERKEDMKERKAHMKDRRKEMKEEMKEDRKEHMDDFKEIFTDKQYQKFQKMQAKRAEHFRNRGNHKNRR